MKKKLLSLIVCAAMVVSLAGCQKDQTAATTAGSASESTNAGKETDAAGDVSETEKTSASDTEETATFTVGFDQEFPPMGFVGDDGEYIGFDLELAEEVAKRLGRTFVPQPINWGSKDMELNAGTIDCIWNGFTMTGREEDYTWSDPYMNNRQVVVVRSDSDIASFDDLAGKIVEVQTDSSAEAALAEMPELTATFSMLQTTPDYNAAFMDLEMGAVDAIAIDVVVASYQIEQRGDGFKMLDGELASEKYGIGFKLGNEALRDQVQAALEEMAADGTVAAISEKWFGSDITTIGK
jgi:polar amino acid transport system substrate-binding protein